MARPVRGSVKQRVKPSGSRYGHYIVEYDTDNQARPITMDARSLTLPSVAIIAVVMSSIGLTYFFARERSRIDARIDTVVNSVENLATSISQLADGLKVGSSDRFTRTQHELFCARLELANSKIGLRCPSVEDLSEGSTGTEFRQKLSDVDTLAKSSKDKAARARRGDDEDAR